MNLERHTLLVTAILLWLLLGVLIPQSSSAQEVRCASGAVDPRGRATLRHHLGQAHNQRAPQDFTEAFSLTKPWVLSIAAGEIVKAKIPKTKDTFVPKSEGSAIIWGSERYIVTNAHVIKGYSELRARTHHRRVIRLRLVGVYKELDIALLETQTPEALADLPSACYRTALPPIGSWVAAVGHPYSMPYSLSTGVISAHHRGARLSEWARYFPGFIQTNITLNPGNSGGPLIDQEGFMVGMNTAIREGAVGMSLALPISRIKPVIEQLRQSGEFKRSYVGLNLSKVSYNRAKRAGYMTPVGVRVKRVAEGGPADIAGIKRNDIILKVNGREFHDPGALSWYMVSALPEIPITIELVRTLPTKRKGLAMIVPKQSAKRDKVKYSVGK